ncbi:hypothetical protein CBFG_02177 [Clostridiales bacterium 1_7_47FAA]|nr:hypothetical protein CBFG_02177 [Clostridiales bacterium 1_7_47FAA]
MLSVGWDAGADEIHGQRECDGSCTPLLLTMDIHAKWIRHGVSRPIFWLKKEIWFDILKWREES